jgi:broad specificity phosphatase PhoE
VIEENEIGVSGSGDGGDLLDFARADERSGIGARAALNELGSDQAAGAQEQLAKLSERFFCIEAGRFAERA